MTDLEGESKPSRKTILRVKCDVDSAFAYVLIHRIPESPLTNFVNVCVEIVAYDYLYISLFMVWEYIIL